MRQRFITGVLLPSLVAVAFSLPVDASVSYSCGAGISADVCNFLNVTIAGYYNNTFTNADAAIYIQLGSTGLGESEFDRIELSYSSYATTFDAESTDSAAIAELPSTNPDVAGGGVYVTAAQLEALGLSITAGRYGVNLSGSSCKLGTSGCYNGVITISNGADLYYRPNGGTIGMTQYDFYSVAEHETDEILGTASCLVDISGAAGNGCTNRSGTSAGVSATDLYRYSSQGTFAWTSSSTAYFSIDGGKTMLAAYNNTPNGGDYGDWVYQSSCSADLVQDYAATPGCSPNIITDQGTPEIQLLNAVGFDLSAPEPATFALLGASLIGLGVIGMQRRRRK
ncbi:MAG TPA: NF038122 family metalloprotease [Bryobacteraceae bacterium]|nr:NF038122 family metalloprotease [Bryobacteraceae bacterium]